MNETLELTLAFLEEAPGAASLVLQEIGIGEAAAFLETVPSRLAAPVVNQMIPAMGARCLERLSAPRAAAILRNLPFHDSASIVRLVRAEKRAGILAELPSSLAKRMHRSLEYSISAVGAWIDPDVPLLSVQDTVEDALRLLRDSRTSSHVFVESASNGQYAGLIGINELMRSAPSARLSQLSIEEIAPISNRAALASVAFLASWDDHLMLPVVGRRLNVLGGLSRTALRRGFHEYHEAQARPRSVLDQIVGALLLTISAVLRLVLRRDLGTARVVEEGSSGD
jgi:Mg/Co/Ni transporter MgtE